MCLHVWNHAHHDHGEQTVKFSCNALNQCEVSKGPARNSARATNKLWKMFSTRESYRWRVGDWQRPTLPLCPCFEESAMLLDSTWPIRWGTPTMEQRMRPSTPMTLRCNVSSGVFGRHSSVRGVVAVVTVPTGQCWAPSVGVAGVLSSVGFSVPSYVLRVFSMGTRHCRMKWRATPDVPAWS